MFLCSREKDYSCLCMWTVFNWLGRNKSLTQCGKNLWKKSIRESQHHSLTMFIWVALNEHAKRAKILWKITETCLNPESLLGFRKNNFVQGNLSRTFPHGPLTWLVMPRNAWKYIANWRTKQLNSYTKSQHHALMTERNCELEKQINSTITRSHNCMPWRQKWRNEICWRIVKSLPSNWSKMLVLGTYWKTWYSLFSEQTCTIDHKMDQSLWQTIESFDLLHSSYMWIHTVLPCGKHQHNNAGWDCFRILALLEIL